MGTEKLSNRSFRYLADPVFLTTLIVYPINRFVLKPHHIGGWFTHGYLNDVLCLPMFVPITLYVCRLLGVRRHDGFPRICEIVQTFAAFVIVFQLVTPRFPKLFVTAGDPWDILAYAVGGVIAMMIWRLKSTPLH